MNSLVQIQANNNRATSGGWEVAAEHRHQVTELLNCGPINRQGRLCILGAGNCNNVELTTLLESFREIHLVDVDAIALERGVTSQGLRDSERVTLHGNVDVTGMQ